MATRVSFSTAAGEKTPLLGVRSSINSDDTEQRVESVTLASLVNSPFYEPVEIRRATAQHTLTVEDGTYVGDVVDGKPHGRGKLTYPPGKKLKWYEGEFNLGVFHGRGVLRHTNGFIENGMWENGQMNGYGKCTYADGSTYKGNFLKGLRHGQGSYKGINTSSYEGEWKEDKSHGQGKWRSVYGDVYEGTYANNKLHGIGTFKSSSGDSYTGQWQNGKQHGQGTNKYSNGDEYTGEWKEGEAHGQGTLIKAGTRLSGIWQNNTLTTGTWGSYQVVNGERQKGTCEESCCVIL